MTLALFVAMVTCFALISSLVVEGIKSIIGDTKPKASTLIALIVACVVGWGGGAATYVAMKIPFNDAINIIALVCTAPSIWLMSTMGYDNFMKIIDQIKKIIDAKK